ncbi:MAG: hypothetical protein B6U88_01075 [Candidatus Aenigmarchaeota archaeon ex4484_56]|nr:MAG: hypothetical protein B6U88_01075 [Candidatus Aenigmarchaeota archaeon ex4484_56]
MDKLIAFIYLIASAAVVFIIYLTFFSGEETTYMNLPDGIWIYIKSANTNLFVWPPTIWFGNTLTKTGSVNFDKIIISSDQKDFLFIGDKSVYLTDVIGMSTNTDINIDYRKLISHSLLYGIYPPASILLVWLDCPAIIQTNYKVVNLPTPQIAIYPLVTSHYSGKPDFVDCNSDICYLSDRKEVGKINYEISFDKNKLESFFSKQGYAIGNLEDNIIVDLYYITDLGVKNIIAKNSKLKDIAYCSPSGDNYNCNFDEIRLIDAKEKFPTIAKFKLNLKINLTSIKDGGWIIKEYSILPQTFNIVYFLDKVENKDYVTDNFGDIGSTFKLDDIYIYPCRTKVRDFDFYEIKEKVKGYDNRIINWNDCPEGYYNELGYSEGYEKSGWFCKKSGNYYYLYNPYAYCRLEGKNLPTLPKPVYFEGIIPSVGLKKKFLIITYKEFKEVSWSFAESIIYRTIYTLTHSGTFTFLDDMHISDCIITYNFS